MEMQPDFSDLESIFASAGLQDDNSPPSRTTVSQPENPSPPPAVAAPYLVNQEDLVTHFAQPVAEEDRALEEQQETDTIVFLENESNMVKIVHQAPESDSKPACDSGVSFVDVSDIEKAIVVVPDGSSSTDGSKGDVQVPQQEAINTGDGVTNGGLVVIEDTTDIADTANATLTPAEAVADTLFEKNIGGAKEKMYKTSRDYINPAVFLRSPGVPAKSPAPTPPPLPSPPSPSTAGTSAQQSAIDDALQDLIDTRRNSSLTKTREEIDDYNSAIAVTEMSSLDVGFTYVMGAPTSGLVRRGEDPLTYLNLHQMYALTMELSPRHRFKGNSATSVISVQFREKEKQRNVKDAVLHWELWMSRQSSPRIRVIDTEHPANLGISVEVEELAHNALKVKWDPLSSAAKVVMCVRCLSTDFSNQKGIKGIPLNIQIDTYDGADHDLKKVIDRAFCQIKTFVDGGAMRKRREDERKMRVRPPNYPLLPSQKKSLFVKTVDGEREPSKRETILFQPRLEDYKDDGDALPLTAFKPRTSRRKQTITVKDGSSTSSASETELMRSPKKSSAATVATAAPLAALAAPTAELPLDRDVNRNISTSPATGRRQSRVTVLVRQENEVTFTALYVCPSTVKGFVKAVSTKYKISASSIRRIFLKLIRGVIVWVDDHMVATLHQLSFVMKVLAMDQPQHFDDGDPEFPEGRLTHYDIVLVEENNNFY